MCKINVLYVHCTMYNGRTHIIIISMNMSSKPFIYLFDCVFTLAGPTLFARISKIMTRQTKKCVYVVNNDNVRMPTIVTFKPYILNILSFDYCTVLKLYRKFEKWCNM